MSSKKLKLLAAAAVLAGGVTLANAEQVDLDSGLRAYWPMHGDLLEQVNPPRHIDQSGNGLNMKFGSGTVALPDAQAPDMQYLHLNGIAGQSSLYVPINKITLNNAAGVTVFFRIRGAGTAAEAADGAVAVVFEVSADHNARAGAICILIVKKSDGWHIFPSAKTASAYAQAYAANPLRADEWTNVAVQYLKDDYPNCIRIFMDGVEQTLVEDDKQRASLKGVTFYNDVVNIGGRNQAKSLVGKMDIDEVGVYGRVLNDAEIVALSQKMSTTNGTVSVSQKVSVLAQPNVTPALGVTSGYAKGDVVPIMWPDAGEQLLAWTLATNATDASGWLPWKRGFGAYGQFVHTGGRVQVVWNPGAIAGSGSNYGWIFGDDPGTEIYGTGNNLTIGSKVEKKDDYLHFTGASGSSAHSSNLNISSASEVTIGFWVRNLDVTAGELLLMETTSNYNNTPGSIYISCKTGYVLTLARKVRDASSTHYYSIIMTKPLTQLADGEWHHIVAVFKKDVWPANFAVYLDDNAVELDATPVTEPKHQCSTADLAFAGQPLHIGGRNGGGAIIGDMKQVQVEVHTKSTITIALNKPVQNEFVLPDGRKFEFECGELLSFAVPPGLFTLEDGTKVTFAGWTLKRRVGLSWEEVRRESARQIEFVCGEDDLRLELKFARQGLVFMLK